MSKKDLKKFVGKLYMNSSGYVGLIVSADDNTLTWISFEGVYHNTISYDSINTISYDSIKDCTVRFKNYKPQ